MADLMRDGGAAKLAIGVVEARGAEINVAALGDIGRAGIVADHGRVGLQGADRDAVVRLTNCYHNLLRRWAQI